MGFAIVAVLFLCSDLLAFMHQAEGDHVVCAEHGELVHAEGAGERVGAAIEPGAAFEASPPRGDFGDTDEHCPSCAAALDAPTVPVACVASYPPLVAARQPKPVAHGSDTAGEILLRAPKTSPPTA